MGQCFPGTPRPRNNSSWVESYPLTYPPRAVVPCRVSVRCRCGKDLRALQRPIECYGIREYKSFLERARGRSSDLGGFRRNGYRSFGVLGPRGTAPSETPYRATGPIHFLAPDFAAAAARRLVVEESVNTGVSAPRATARRATGSRKPPAASSIWAWCSAWTAGAARWPTACVLRAEESSLMGRFMISIMSAFSELEREMIVERVVAGVKKAQAAGKHCGRPGASSGGTGSWS